MPALTGAIILARPLYTVFYGSSEEQAVRLFVAVLCLTLLMALYTLFSPMLQALFENRKAIYYFAYGVFVKLVLQVPLIYLFHAYGPLLATTLGLLVPIYLMYRRLYQVTRFNRKLLHKRILLTVIETALMGLIVLLSSWLLGYVIKPTGRLTSLLYLVIIGGLGMAVYAYMTLLTRQLDKLIGSRAARYRQKLGL